MKRSETIVFIMCIALSLFCHVGLLASLLFSYVPQLPQSEAPGYVIPAYTQAETAEASKAAAVKAAQPAVAEAERQMPSHNDDVKLANKKSSSTPSPSPQKHIKPNNDAYNDPVAIPQTDEEPLHLVGKSKIIKPLIKVLAQALQQHLRYPKSAADFHLTGTVLIGFTLHPEGLVTDAKVVQSSGAGVLDDAARIAVMEMSPVSGATPYVSSAQYLVVGIIFG